MKFSPKQLIKYAKILHLPDEKKYTNVKPYMIKHPNEPIWNIIPKVEEFNFNNLICKQIRFFCEKINTWCWSTYNADYLTVPKIYKNLENYCLYNPKFHEISSTCIFGTQNEFSSIVIFDNLDDALNLLEINENNEFYIKINEILVKTEDLFNQNKNHPPILPF